MPTLTVSTNGLGRELKADAHEVEDIRYHRFFGASEIERDVAGITLTPEQALGIAIDLLMQLVNADVLRAWNVVPVDRG